MVYFKVLLFLLAPPVAQIQSSIPSINERRNLVKRINEKSAACDQLWLYKRNDDRRRFILLRRMPLAISVQSRQH